VIGSATGIGILPGALVGGAVGAGVGAATTPER
jgi:osmotically inducible lipoprotein OsmB